MICDRPKRDGLCLVASKVDKVKKRKAQKGSHDQLLLTKTHKRKDTSRREHGRPREKIKLRSDKRSKGLRK